MARDKKQIYEASDWFKDALQVTILFIACSLCTNVMSTIRVIQAHYIQYCASTILFITCSLCIKVMVLLLFHMTEVKRSTFYFTYVCTLCVVSLCSVVWWVRVPFYKMGTGLRTCLCMYVGESGQCRHMGINWKPAPGQGGMGSGPEEVWARAAKPFHQCWHVLQVGHWQRVAGDALPEPSRQEQGGTHFYFKIYACNSEWVTNIMKWCPSYVPTVCSSLC